jgi:O-antigen/teichoic acid export membrane protein
MAVIEDPMAGIADQAVAAHRDRRERRVLASTGAAVAARLVAMLGSFLVIPLAIGYLGVDRYGIFLALSSLTSVLVFADLGLANGLLNVVSDANGRDDRGTARRAVSSALVMIVAVASLLALVFLLVFGHVNWPALLNVNDPVAAAEVGPTALVIVALFLIGLPLGIVERVRLAYQEGYINSFAAMLGGIAGLGALVVAIWLKVSLPVLVISVLLPPVLALALNGFALFRIRRPWLAPRLSLASRSVAARLARLGFLFLVLQLAVAVAYQSDVIVAGLLLGPSAAATYSVTLRFFMLAPALIAVFLTALWPAYTEALARNDIEWVRRTLRRSIVIALVTAGPASLVLAVGGSWLIRTWTGGAIDPPLSLMVGAALWAVVSATFNTIAIVLNAASVVRFQVIIATTMAIASITLSVLFARAFGISGIIWGTLLAFVLIDGIPMAIYVPRFLASLDRQRAQSLAGPGS